MVKRWQDNLPEGAPTVKRGESRGRYAARILREASAKSIDRLAQAVRERRAQENEDDQ